MQQLTPIGYRLPLTITRMEDGSYMATSTQLDGFLVLADTIEDVVQLAPDIARSLIVAMREKGVEPPLTSEEFRFPIDLEVLVV